MLDLDNFQRIESHQSLPNGKKKRIIFGSNVTKK